MAKGKGKAKAKKKPAGSGLPNYQHIANQQAVGEFRPQLRSARDQVRDIAAHNKVGGALDQAYDRSQHNLTDVLAAVANVGPAFAAQAQGAGNLAAGIQTQVGARQAAEASHATDVYGQSAK